MFEFEVFTSSLRHVFSQFVGIRDLTSESIAEFPPKFQDVSARIDLEAEQPATIWLNITQPGVSLVMQSLKIPHADEDRMLMDTVGELLNIVVGAAQRNSTVRYEFSLPKAYKGDGYALRFSPTSTKTGRRFIFEDFEALLLLEQ
jgi:hypothetical protein